MAARGVEPGARTAWARLPPDGALARIEALCPAAPAGAPYARGVLVAGCTAHGRHGQDEMPIADALVADLPALPAPMGHVNCGAPQAPRRLATHRHQLLPLAAVQATVCDGPALLRMATRQPRRHQARLGGALVARMGVLKRLPVLGKDLLADTPVPRGGYQQRMAPSWGDTLVVGQRLYHA